jgi:hypothetical protein
MSQLDDFLTPTLVRQLDAEQALINGDPGPRLAMWSTQEPVTVFGPAHSTGERPSAPDRCQETGRAGVVQLRD